MNTKFYTPPDCKLSEGAHLHAHLFSYSELTEIVWFFFLIELVVLRWKLPIQSQL